MVNNNQIQIEQIEQRLEMSDTQNVFIQILYKYLNDIKEEGIADEILNERIIGCADDLIKLIISKCSDQVKDKLPEQV